MAVDKEDSSSSTALAAAARVRLNVKDGRPVMIREGTTGVFLPLLCVFCCMAEHYKFLSLVSP